MKQLFRIFLLLCTTTFLGYSASAEGHEEEHEAHGEFNAGEMITHHIADAHIIHIAGPIQLPLPVILWTDKGLDMFSSSNFAYDNMGHPTATYTSPKTGYTYENHHETIYIIDGMEHDHAAEGHAEHTSDAHAESNGVKPMDFSITKTVFGMLFVILLMIVLFSRVSKAYKKRQGQAPKGVQNVMETLILFVRDEVAIPSIGKGKADKYVPFLLTAFFFIWMCNLLGLIPFLGGFNITGTMGVTIVLAGIVFIMTIVSGNKHYWAHILWPPGVPLALKPMLIAIEFAQIFIKPAVLMVRLTANITAGHIIILAFVSLIIIFGQNGDAVGAGFGVGIGATAFMIFMFFIELLVAFLQAYVFILLAAIYFGDATSEAHH